jgi:alkaline phosphatase D
MTTRRHLLQLALAAGLGPVFHRHVLAADVPRFALGIASGQPLPQSLVLWTRLTGDGLPPQVQVRWELAADEAFTQVVARGSETATHDEAHSVHAEPGGLAPGRSYWYRFTALGQQSAVGRTRTAPAPDAAATLDFAVASCQRWDHGHWAAWRDLAADAPDLVLFLGDYIYEGASPAHRVRRHVGGPCRTLADYRARYAQYKSDPALQAAHAAAPWLLVWDDHEVENDYAGLHSEKLGEPDFATRRACAYRAWWEHQPVPKAFKPRGADTTIYQRLDWGRLARLQLTDARQYRDPQVCPPPGEAGGGTVKLAQCAALRDERRTMMGAAQERWLAEGWDHHRPWNLLAQQTLMSRFSWGDPARDPAYWTDGWDGYAPARQRLLQALAARSVPNAVVLGGDVHANYVADLKLDFDDPAAPIVASELCGTSISSHGLAPERLAAALPFNPHIRYGRSDQRGLLRCRLDSDALQVQLRVVAQPDDPASTVATAARFVVAAGRPGAQPA